MVFVIAGGSADLQHHRAMETRVDQKVERTVLGNGIQCRLKPGSRDKNGLWVRIPPDR